MSTKHTSFIPMSPSLLPRQKLYEVLELPELPKRLDPNVGMDDPDEKNDHYLQFIRRAKTSKIGRRAKAADIRDKLDITRIDGITDQDIKRLNRYKVALKLLGD